MKLEVQTKESSMRSMGSKKFKRSMSSKESSSLLSWKFKSSIFKCNSYLCFTFYL